MYRDVSIPLTAVQSLADFLLRLAERRHANGLHGEAMPLSVRMHDLAAHLGLSRPGLCDSFRSLCDVGCIEIHSPDEHMISIWIRDGDGLRREAGRDLYRSPGNAADKTRPEHI